MQANNLKQYCQAGFFTDSNHPDVQQLTHRVVKGIAQPEQQCIALFNYIRDRFKYNPYHIVLQPDALKASYLLQKESGYCVEKSNLMAACARVLGIPARLGYSNVRNHLGTDKIEQYLKTDVMVFHGFAEIYLHRKWIKLTPVFNKELCAKYNVDVLQFDGHNDAIFQEKDKSGKLFMEYLHHYGTFQDVPFDLFKSELRRFYPHLFVRPEQYPKFRLEF